ncbi:hypothetical protein QE152_g34370 [Popillia japonica]|uniref:Uncharacterized protein n=1 Tax=Popillia japonica TaxID=7064 RepID=A0AAW1ITR7_POPJA
MKVLFFLLCAMLLILQEFVACDGEGEGGFAPPPPDLRSHLPGPRAPPSGGRTLPHVAYAFPPGGDPPPASPPPSTSRNSKSHPESVDYSS